MAKNSKNKALQQSKDLLDTADSYVPNLAAAFKNVIDTIRNEFASQEALEIALSQNNIDALFAATQIDQMDNLMFGVGVGQQHFVFSDQWRVAFMAGAATAISHLNDELQKTLAFDPLGERAIAYIKQQGAQLVVDLSNSSKAGIQQVLQDGIINQRTLREQARTIRQLIGLTDAQAKAVLNFRAQLETRQLLGFTPPDERRLNAIEQAMVRRHMKEGHFNQQQIDSMVETYYQRLLNLRAMDVARTEALNAVNSGQLELWYQGHDQGLFNDDVDRKFWIVTHDDRLRASHRAIPTMNPWGVPIKHKFATPFGSVNSPGDANKNLINCRCTVILGEVGQQFF